MRKKKEPKTYEDVWTTDFHCEYSTLKNLYKYQRFNRSEKGYDEIIIELIKGDNNDLNTEFMNIINWIVLWKTDRIIEFNEGNCKNIQIELNWLKDASIAEIEDDNYAKSKALFTKLLTESNKGIQLAMASTIMHFYRPDCFPIIDKRAYRAINSIKVVDGRIKSKEPEKDELVIMADPDSRVNVYFKYLTKCKQLVEDLNKYDHNASISDIDQFLYQIDKLTKQKIKGLKI